MKNEINLPPVDSELARRCIEADGNQVKIAMVALDYLDGFRRMPEPFKPTCAYDWEEYVGTYEYKKLPFDKKAAKLQEQMKKKEFYAYRKSLEEVRRQNESNFTYLKHMMETFAEYEMTAEMAKVNAVLNKYYVDSK